MREADDGKSKTTNTARQVLFASLIGTAIEFFDFYIYATAAVLVFPRLFFPASDPTTAMLSSLATFGIAFSRDRSAQRFLAILEIVSDAKQPWSHRC